MVDPLVNTSATGRPAFRSPYRSGECKGEDYSTHVFYSEGPNPRTHTAATQGSLVSVAKNASLPRGANVEVSAGPNPGINEPLLLALRKQKDLQMLLFPPTGTVPS